MSVNPEVTNIIDSAAEYKVDGDRIWDSLMQMAKIGATEKVGGRDVHAYFEAHI